MTRFLRRLALVYALVALCVFLLAVIETAATEAAS